MKSVFFLIILLTFSMSFGQAKMISKTRTITVMEETAISTDNAYNVLTGKRFNQRQLNELIRNNPNVYVEHEFDEYGKIIKFWFNPNRIMGQPTTIGRTSTGEKFPEFAFVNVNGETLDSKDFVRKWTIIRFEGYAEDFMFKAKDLIELDEKITAFEKVGHEVIAFDIFNWDATKSKKIFTVDKSKFHVIPNGRNLIQKFKILRTPKTLVINPNGVLMGYFNYSEDIDLIALSKQ